MPKRLALLRHAKSDWGEPGLADFDRPLKARGREAAARMRAAVMERGLEFGAILSSPARRTRETLEIMGLAERARWDESLYHADARRLLRAVHELPGGTSSALVAGHNPGLQQLALQLAASSRWRDSVAEKFPTGALALLEFGADDWRRISHGQGLLIELLRPRDLA